MKDWTSSRGGVAHGGDLHRHRGVVQQGYLGDSGDLRICQTGHDGHDYTHLDEDQRSLKAGGGLAIDTDCHVLTEDKKAIPGLYAAGDVCGSIEEKDAKQYGMGFDAALTYGYVMGETLKKEI